MRRSRAFTERAEPAPSVSRDRRILVVSRGRVHPSLASRYLLRRILLSVPGMSVHFTSTLSPSEAPHLYGENSRWDAVVLFFHEKQDRPDFIDFLRRSVEAGCGLLAVHSASASFKSSRLYRDILGGRFVSHGRIEPLQMIPLQPSLRMFSELGPYRLRDELYRHDWDRENSVHYGTASGSDGELEPQCWTRMYGKGRVFYFAPGHRSGTFRHPVVREVLRRAVVWTAGADE